MKAFDHQGDEVTKPEPGLDGLDRSNREWKLHASALEHDVLSNTEQTSRGLSQGEQESRAIFTMIMELVLREPIKSWKVRKLGWSLDVAKLKKVALTVGAEKTHWTSHPKMIYESIVVDGLSVLWKEALEFV